jgi:hypothetical protein
VNAFGVPSGQQTHGCFRLFLQSRLVSHFFPARQRRGRASSAAADDVKTGAT